MPLAVQSPRSMRFQCSPELLIDGIPMVVWSVPTNKATGMLNPIASHLMLRLFIPLIVTQFGLYWSVKIRIGR